MFKESFLKATFLGLMLTVTSVGFAQDLRIGGWKVEYVTNDFGDRTGECSLSQTVFSEDLEEFYFIYIAKLIDEIVIMIDANFKNEIADRDAYLSFKTENNKVIEAEKGDYRNKSKSASFEMTNEIISLFKNSSKLKIAVRLQGCKPSVFEIDCKGFTKAYNEMLNCK